jgi:SAM-dependent methyltransferase
MSFYAQFAAHYERVFPLREGTLAFLRRRLPSAGRVLDLGCGTGHYCGALAAAGLQAVGIDLDLLMIEAARAAYPSAEFHVLDLRDVAALASPFGGAYCIGNVLPHLRPADVDDLLRSLRAVLSSGAPLIIQTVNFDRLLPLREPHQFPDLDAGGGLVFRRRYLQADGGAVRFVTELREDDRVLFTGEETLWPWHAADLIAAGAAAGLEPVEHCGDFAGTPFVPHDSGANVLILRTPC